MRAELFTITLPGYGPLSVMARPRGGDWLSDEVASWQEAGITMIVSLLTRAEEEELEIGEEAALCQQCQMQFLSLPIPDRQVPADHEQTIQVIDAIVQELQAQKHVAIHCRVGIGRSALIAAGALIALGKQPDEALTMIATARGCPIPDTDQQRAWVRAFPLLKRH